MFTKATTKTGIGGNGLNAARQNLFQSPAKSKTEALAESTLVTANQCLRQANIATIPTVFRQAVQYSGKHEINPRLRAELQLKAAEMARMIGQSGIAERLADGLIENTPSGALDLRAAAQRLRVSLYLDAGEQAAAVGVIGCADALEITSSEMMREGAGTVVMRHDSDVSPETWLREAEVCLTLKQLEQAANCLEKGAQKISALEHQFRQNKGLTPNGQNQIRVRLRDLRNELHFFDAVLRVQAGDAQGLEMLNNLRLSLKSDGTADRRLYGRLRACGGDWDKATGKPPLGCNLPEALRLYALGQMPNNHFHSGESDELFVSFDETVDLLNLNEGFSDAEAMSVGEKNQFDFAAGDGNASALARQPPMAIEMAPAAPIASLDVSALTNALANLTNVIASLPQQSPAPPTTAGGGVRNRPFAFGGGFAHFDLVTQLGSAEQVNFTGFFEVQWSPELIETSVLTKRIDALARQGLGFVFMNDGEIIDATIGSFDPAEEFKAGTENAKADALRALTLMIQVGLTLGLDNPVEGFGAGYASAAVSLRESRIRLTQVHLASIITERERQLNLLSEGDNLGI